MRICDVPEKVCLLILSILTCLPCMTRAQNQTSAFGFLELSISSHEAALGGRNVSISEPDPAMTYSNPAVLTGIDKRMLGLNFMTWIAGSVSAGAQYCNKAGARSSFAVTARYINYGISDLTDAVGNSSGTFSSRDIAIGGTYSYRLGDRWSGGATLNTIYSKYSYYSSFAMAVNLGLTYTSLSGRFNAGVSFANIGGQIKPFQDIRETLPFNITAGLSMRLEHAPLRLSLTLDRLNRWSDKDFYSPDGTLSSSDMFFRHVILGADILITDRIYAAVGYNFKNAAELSTDGHKGLIGVSLGAGVNLDRVSFGLSYGQFQVSTPSFIFNFAINI